MGVRTPAAVLALRGVFASSILELEAHQVDHTINGSIGRREMKDMSLPFRIISTSDETSSGF